MKKTAKRVLITLATLVFLTFALAMTISAEEVGKTDSGAPATFYFENGTLTVERTGPASNGWNTLKVTETSTAYEWLSNEGNRALITHIEVGDFHQLQSNIFSGLINLESVHFQLAHSRIYDMQAFFSGCESLTTVWYGDDVNKIEGCANLTTLDVTKNDHAELFIVDTFKNCKSLKSIILPTISDSSYASLNASMFSGCDALEWVRADSSILSIADDTFTGLENFKGVIADIGTTAQIWASANNLYPTILDRKPTTEALAGDYLILDAQDTPSNVKFEYHNIGTAANPEYALYYFIDTASTNTASTKITSHMVSQNDYGYSTHGNKYVNNPQYAANSELFNNTKYISIEDGITGLYGACFLGSPASVVEMPASLVSLEYASFKNMSNLHTVYTRGGSIEMGTVDLSNLTTVNLTSQYGFAGCSSVKQYKFNENVDSTEYGYGTFTDNTSLESFNVPAALVYGMQTNTFGNCTSLREITVNNSMSLDGSPFKGCTSLSAIWAAVGTPAHAYALSMGYDTNHTLAITQYSQGIASYDPDTKTVSFLPSPDGYTHLSGGAREYQTFANAYKNYAEKAYIGNFGKLRTYGGNFFDGWPYLKEVNFASTSIQFQIADFWLFKDCDALTTVWFGDESAKQNGAVVFPSVYSQASDSDFDYYQELIDYFIYDCGAVERVILPNDRAYTITANSFYNCTSLREITIPSMVSGIADGAFSTCTSLRRINLSASASIVTAGSVSGTNGLVIYTQSVEDADTINTALAEGSVPTSSAFAFCKSGMDILGYSVRTSGYNGLRTHFSFDETAPEGYTLVEYGSIVATAENWNKYIESFGAENSILTLSEDEFVTPAENIIKTAIYKNGNYVNNSVSGENGREFAVTVVRFDGETQIKAEIVNSGYEIWKKGENYYVLFTRESAFGYDTISLYKTTMGMLKDETISVSMDAADPVWGTLNTCVKTELAIADEGITAYTFADPINTDKVVAVYLTASDTETTLTDLGFTLAEKEGISDFIIGKNVKYDLPLLDYYWEEHIEETLASMEFPEGSKSFIAFTDTHYQSAKDRNTRKLNELIKYVRMRTGINTVLNLGDPYTGEGTLESELPEALMKEAVKTDFYDYFGDGALFAVGNHDANWATWARLEVSDGTNGEYAYNYYLPDTLIYEYGYKALEGKVVFDQNMIDLADDIDYAYALEQTNGKYTEEQLKAEFVAWAKQHYHYDDTEAKIRYISMNTGNCGFVEDYIFGYDYIDENGETQRAPMYWGAVIPSQYDWLYDVLTTTPDGYDIVLMGHMFGDSTIGSQAQGWLFYFLSAFAGGYETDVGEVNGATANLDLLYGNTEELDKKTYKFTEAFDGTIFAIGGHHHGNYTRVWGASGLNVDYVEGNTYGDNDFFIISLAEDCLDFPDTRGNISENGFAIVTITEDNKIIVTGFGDVSSRTVSK